LGFSLSALRERTKNVIKYSPKHQARVAGKMNEKDAGRVGNKLANAALIISFCWGLSALIFALAYWLK
jgi:hypothetical protein